MSQLINIKLKPIDDYFFGKENLDKKGDANYFLKSNHLPQVTTVLGAIRYWLLIATNNFENNAIQDKKKATEDIGDKSYVVGEAFHLGKIEKVSNLFLLDKDNHKFIPAPSWLDKEGAQFDWNDALDAAILPGYNAKEYYPSLFTNGSAEKSYDSIFTESEYSHNRKNDRNNDQEDSFFKTQTFRLKDNFSFGLTVWLRDDLKINKESCIFKMGGENKLFQLEIIETTLLSEQDILKSYTNNQYPKIVFTSDAYLPELKKSDYLFGIINTKNFRSLFAEIEKVQNYNALSKNDPAQIVKSELKQLLEAGSVLYFKETQQANDFISCHLKNQSLSKAGFNHYILLNPKENQTI
ncbi:MAG: hypothetical protein LC105_01395 [Chitinophagales bacterium]|nr:hypothetical protein [Chitinophagales bacterium]